MRTFIAIELEENLKNQLSSLISEFMNVSQNIKWVKKQGMHLTLKFLGEIGLDKVNEIESCMEKIAKKTDSFVLQIKGTGFFPPGKKNPRVLWVGITGDSSLLNLQAEVESGCERLGFPQEMRKFHPHLTLGRVKAHSKLGGVLPLLEKNRETPFGEMIVKKITFFQSLLKPTGAEYKVLSEFNLK